MNPSTCEHCGARLTPETLTCERCGEATPAAIQLKRRRFITLFIGVSLFCLAMMLMLPR
ncbi:MAG: hypothetical protein AB2813_05905 [Candidatus Sedimenticola endophacoides]